MIHVKVRSIIADDNMIVEGLTQWDRGQKLEIVGLNLPSSVEIHFAQKDDEDATPVVGSTMDGVTQVDIPDRMLQFSETIHAYIYLSDKSFGETIFTIHLPIRERNRPSTYFADPNPDNPFGQLVEQVSQYTEQAAGYAEEAKKSLDQITKDLDEANGKFASKEDVGNKEDLQTDTKENIVAAINEMAEKYENVGQIELATVSDINDLFNGGTSNEI